jgi:hypothetical protein
MQLSDGIQGIHLICLQDESVAVLPSDCYGVQGFQTTLYFLGVLLAEPQPVQGFDDIDHVDQDVDVMPVGFALGQVGERQMVFDLQVQGVGAVRPDGFQTFKNVPQRVQ